jgi:hypothetical protein
MAVTMMPPEIPGPLPPPITRPPVMPSPVAPPFAGYGELSDLGSNWRIKFADADGIPLNMLSFDVIDFGAIAFKEIFQNVKTILATPLYSAALERSLGLDQTIVDRPIPEASQATVAILDALFFWEPRSQAVNIQFSADVVSGHMICNLQMNIRNVIYGSDTPYNLNNFFPSPTKTPPLPPIPLVIPPPPPPSTDRMRITTGGQTRVTTDGRVRLAPRAATI